MGALLTVFFLVFYYPPLLPVGIISWSLLSMWRAREGADRAVYDAAIPLRRRLWVVFAVALLVVQAVIAFALFAGGGLPYLLLLAAYVAFQDTVIVRSIRTARDARHAHLAGDGAVA